MSSSNKPFFSAIQKIGKNIKHIFIGLELLNLSSPPTSLKNHYYKEFDFIKDLNIYLPQKFKGLDESKINALWKKFKKIFKKVFIFENIDKLQKCDYEIYKRHFTLIKAEIFRQLNILSMSEKFAIFIFTKYRNEHALILSRYYIERTF